MDKTTFILLHKKFIKGSINNFFLKIFIPLRFNLNVKLT